MAYYAVRVGRKPGIYFTWADCRAQVHGFSGAVYKKFDSREEAEQFLIDTDLKKVSLLSPVPSSVVPRDRGFVSGGSKHKDFPKQEKRVRGRGDSIRRDTAEPPDFSELPEGECVAYVDGSYHARTKVFGYGVVFFSHAGKETFYGRGTGEDARHRNVAGEILGAEKAMDLAVARGARKLTIYHDYAGIRHWALGEWRTNLPRTKAYQAHAAEVRKKVLLEFVKVEAHTGDVFNDEADQLAKKGAGIAKG